MNTVRNAIVGQSGGPTTVINSSLAGVISKYLEIDGHGTIFGALNGIKGLLREDIIPLNQTFENPDNIRLLKQTPASYLGSCRHRITDDSDEEMKKIVEIFNKNNIGYFFYIGGNDSMDTVMKLSEYCDNSVKIIGVPKTIDNDLIGTDHCPGYGSCAKYIASTMAEVGLDSGCYDIKNVLIVEIMGRNAGWLTAASALARYSGQTAPDLIYLPEVAFDTEKFLFDIRQKLLNQDTVVVAVSEGIKDSSGVYISEDKNIMKDDMFGHGQLGGVAKKLEILVKNRLGIKVRGVELNIPQRCAAHIASKTDVDEAFMCGYKAVEAALGGESGKMITMKRNSEYSISFESIDIKAVANGEKKMPAEFISGSGNDVTDDFLRYATPLILGECDVTYKNGLPEFIVR